MKLTPWYPPNQKPARVGVYETRLERGMVHPWDGFCIWTGEHWCPAQHSPRNAHFEGSYMASSVQRRHWRGVLK